MRGTEAPTDTILVVDDNAANRLLVQAALGDEGYDVITATGGVDGIAAFERSRPSCVLLDVRMPDLDGFAVCERIRSLPHGTETSILFLTAQRDVDTFDRALRAGGDDFLTKPIRPTELVVRVRSALKLRRVSVELREHYELLRQQRDDLLRLQLHKERLMAFVVHDLKNPVNSLDLHAQILQRNRWLPVDAADSVAAIRREAKQLTRMISNLLDISKADGGRLAPKLSDIDLHALVDEVLSELAVTAEERDVGLRRSLEAERIFADQDLFQRVLTNLVENAIRYSPVRTAVTVAARKVADGTELRVADAGRGIAPEMREQVFNPFVQIENGDSLVATPGGRGLGLTFCKVAVEAHGGRIWVEDAAPGAVFCVSLPHVT
jgi:two-component system, sensor histidine kinase and response regulator